MHRSLAFLQMLRDNNEIVNKTPNHKSHRRIYEIQKYLLSYENIKYYYK